MYQKCKDDLVAKLTSDVELLSNKARFILMVVEGELEIRRKRKADLLTEFKKLKFTPMSELADVAETQEKVTDKTEYDYLLNMNLWSLTHEEAEEIKKELQTKKEELDILKATSIESMRNCDLGYNFGTGMLRFDMRSLQPRETLTICSQYAWLAVPLLLCGLLACLSKSTSKAAAKPLRAKETRVATNAPGRMCNSAA